MTSIKNDKEVKEKNQKSTPISPDILEMVSFDVDFEIPAKKEYQIEVEIEEITKYKIDKSDFKRLFLNSLEEIKNY